MHKRLTLPFEIEYYISLYSSCGPYSPQISHSHSQARTRGGGGRGVKQPLWLCFSVFCFCLFVCFCCLLSCQRGRSCIRRYSYSLSRKLTQLLRTKTPKKCRSSSSPPPPQRPFSGGCSDIHSYPIGEFCNVFKFHAYTVNKRLFLTTA